mmetsp:Transcript_11088/g.36484  ORF Transcript_11088/g.36484 Transcript_11088/m.36484 type:complete len:246 (+) Transcript_11088:1534-2271(+)
MDYLPDTQCSLAADDPTPEHQDERAVQFPEGAPQVISPYPPPAPVARKEIDCRHTGYPQHQRNIADHHHHHPTTSPLRRPFPRPQPAPPPPVPPPSRRPQLSSRQLRLSAPHPCCALLQLSFPLRDLLLRHCPHLCLLLAPHPCCALLQPHFPLRDLLLPHSPSAHLHALHPHLPRSPHLPPIRHSTLPSAAHRQLQPIHATPPHPTPHPCRDDCGLSTTGAREQKRSDENGTPAEFCRTCRARC